MTTAHLAAVIAAVYADCIRMIDETDLPTRAYIAHAIATRAAAVSTVPALLGLTDHAAALAEALRGLVGLTSRLDHSEGYCCCGDSMESHESPMFSGHTPVDAGEYYVGKSLENARAALAAYDAAASEKGDA